MVGNLLEFAWLKRNSHGPQFTDTREHRRGTVSSNSVSKRHDFNSIPPTSHQLISASVLLTYSFVLQGRICRAIRGRPHDSVASVPAPCEPVAIRVFEVVPFEASTICLRNRGSQSNPSSVQQDRDESAHMSRRFKIT